MNQITNKELTKIENNILVFIKEICDKNQIKYFLAYGTLLGAVRHSGFIPWDDDIDICMFREDYNKFRTIIGSHIDCQYKLVYLDTENKYSLPLPKVIDTKTHLIQSYQRETFSLGVYVDIFILDNIPTNKTIRKFHIFKINQLSKFWNFAQNNDVNDNFFKSFCRRILWIIGPRFFARKIDKLANKYNNRSTLLCGNMTFSPDRYKTVMPKSFFGNGQILEFERSCYSVPEKYKDYLAQLYDDYMIFPPVEARVSLHNFTAYYR